MPPLPHRHLCPLPGHAVLHPMPPRYLLWCSDWGLRLFRLSSREIDARGGGCISERVPGYVPGGAVW